MQKLRRTITVVEVVSVGNLPNGLDALAFITRHSLETIKTHYDAFAQIRDGLEKSKFLTQSIFGVPDNEFRLLDFETNVKNLVEQLKSPLPILDENAIRALKELSKKVD